MSPPTPVYTVTERWYRTGHDIGSETTGSDGARGSYTVAEIVGHARHGALSENDLRNARLIAQAPALREALKAIEPWLSKVTDVHPSARDAKQQAIRVLQDCDAHE